VITALLGVATVDAHQTGSNKGVSVTLHVAPDDAPVTGRPATIIVTRVDTRQGTFSALALGAIGLTVALLGRARRGFNEAG
jgi:hypothetical protein